MVRRVWGLLLLAALQFQATPASSAPEHAAIIVDADTGAVLVAVEPNHRWYPASLTKMMTVYLAFEEIEAKRLGLQEALTVSERAASQPATGLGLGAGKSLSVEQAILAVILQSANDAAVVLAERIAGTEAEFAKRMTDKARALGMTRTVFRNASGLPDPAQVTTARDMAVLGRALLRDFPQYYHYFAARSFTYNGASFGTLNGILARYPGADGIKTGFTCGSGYNLVASATRGGRRLVGVVLGGKSSASRSAEMARLLDAGFALLGQSGPLGLRPKIDAPPSQDEPDPPAGDLFSVGECARGTAATQIAGSMTPSGGRLPGWGVILGVFFSQGEANATVKKTRTALHGVVAAGRTTLVPRRWSGVKSYAALLFSLKQEEASTACKQLRIKGLYCQTLNPQLLNDPNAVWR